jgi:hypothetical protein
MEQENKPTVETKEKLTAELIPEEGTPDVGYKVFEILDEILKFKNDLGLPDKWNRNYELGRNKHWKQDTGKATLITANLLHTHRSRTVNMLTDNNPTFNVHQVGEADVDKEDLFDSLLHTAEYWWTEQEQQSVLEASVLNGETYGCTIEKVIFNSDLEAGFGEVETEVVDPFYFGLYPVRCMTVQKAEAVLHYWPMSVREARRRWTDHAEVIKSDAEYLQELGDTRIDVQPGKNTKAKGYLSTISGIVKNMLNTSADGSGQSDQVLIVECWVRDYTRTPGDQPDKFVDKYPGNIRCIQTCNGGKVILSDRPNPSINPKFESVQASKTYLFSRFPFTLTQSVRDTTNPWGMSDFEQLESLNIEVDKTISQMTLMKDQVSRIKIINPKDSGVSNNEFSNAPGIINPSSSMVAQAIRYLDLPNIPWADMANALTVYKDYFFLVSGTFELEAAQTPGREVIAYKAIAALLERAALILRGKIRNYSKMVRERGRMYISHVMNWYTEERFISYEQDGEKVTKAINGTDMLIPAKLGVVSGSTMPVSKVQEREEAIELFRMGAIDGEALLEKIDWPNRKRVVQRMRLGPIGEFLERLTAMGAPPAMTEAFQEIAQMEGKEFERALEQGKIPMFAQLLTAPEEEGQTPEQNAEMMKTDAEVRKVDAEIRLIEEKIQTEKVGQTVALAGVEFDQEKLQIERAQAVNALKTEEYNREMGIRAQEHTETVDNEKVKNEAKKIQGPYREKGLKSNNK